MKAEAEERNAAAPGKVDIDAFATLYTSGRYAEAAVLAEQITQRFPQDTFGWKALAITYGWLGRNAEALGCVQKALTLAPQDAEAHNTLGIVLTNLEQFKEAESSFKRAIALAPDYAEVYYNLGSTLNSMQRLDEAERNYLRALQLQPAYPAVYYELANTLFASGRMNEAANYCRQALHLKSDFPEAYNSLGSIQVQLEQFEEAEISYRRALQLQPDYVKATWNLSLLLLTLGRYPEAWPLHESRYDPRPKNFIARMPNLPFPQWRGESLTGKSLLIWPEQGFGDYVQFIRYAPLLKENGLAQLTLVCDFPLKALLETVSGVDTVTDNAKAIVNHDYWSFPLSLPLHFGTTVTTIPATTPYISASPARREQWRDKLPQSGFKVGLVWKGNPRHANDANRSLPGLGTLAPLWQIPGISFISLQKHPDISTEEDTLSAQPLVALGAHIRDFADVAAIIAELDLVICVDTAVAHVAGALNKPCWLLLPHNADWRWLRKRADSPWYPSMRLFRQSTANDWRQTVNELVRALQLRVRQNSEFTAPDVSDLERLTTLFTTGQHEQAYQFAEELSSHFPAHPAAWKALGALLGRMGKTEEALTASQKAAAIFPHDAETHNNIGISFKKLGRLAEAEDSYRRALDIKPDDIDIHFNLASTIMAQGKTAAAEAIYRQAVAQQPNRADTHYNLGTALMGMEKVEEAVACYVQALQIHSDYVEALNNLGTAFLRLGELEKSEASLKQALEIDPENAITHYNLGNTLKRLDRLEESAASFRQALHRKPDYVDVYNNLGLVLSDLGLVDEAQACYRQALRIKPDYAESEWNLSLLLLSLGQYAEAWPLHEARYNPHQQKILSKLPALAFPQWQGESLTGKSLLIWPEQGYGDYIQFARYTSMLKECGLARLTLLCASPLKALLENIPAVDEVLTENAVIPQHDYWVFPLSLPVHFGTTVDTIPIAIPYLSISLERQQKWTNHFPPSPELKVGLVWKGSTLHRNDSKRSLPGLATLAPLWNVPGIRFISLQKGNDEEAADTPPATQPLMALGAEITDFADTAAIIAQLDLVICVDTAVAHLAGALGKPCWVLLAHSADWRWLRTRQDSPWYPGSMRLFRQPKRGDWNTPVQDMADALARWHETAQQAIATEPHAEQLRRLTALFSSGRYIEAISLAKELTVRFPKHGTGWKALGSIYGLTGRNTEALTAIQRAVELSPEDAEAHYNLGIAWRDQGNVQESISSFRHVLRINPYHVDAHHNLAHALSALKHLDEAIYHYRQTLQLKPENLVAQYNLGNILLEKKQPEEAATCYRYLLQIAPDYAEAHNNLGIALKEMGILAEAEVSYRHAIQINPHYAEAYNNLGVTLKLLGRIDEAEGNLRQAIQIKAHYAEAETNLASLLQESGRNAEAQASYRRVLTINPHYPDTHFHLAKLLANDGKLHEAEEHYRAALQIKADCADTLANFGVLLTRLKRLEEAIQNYRHALRINPDFAQAHLLLGIALVEIKNAEEAESAYRQALTLKPDLVEATWSLSLLLLTQGRYGEAWPLHESRYDNRLQTKITTLPNIPYCQWHGEPLAGKSFLLWPEQGYGDYIQFIRYAALLKERGVTRLTVACAPALKPLLQTIPAVDAVVTNPVSVSHHDYWAFPLSLPLHFGTTIDTIPANLPYLTVWPKRMEYWRKRLPDRGFKVGLVWQGNPAHTNDANRSITDFRLLAPLWKVPGITFFSLQKQDNGKEDDQGTLVVSEAAQPIIKLGSELRDFADTAAVISQLDLVICVDTAVAHLAGALGKPCWVLLAHRADWRWLADRNDSPWYPATMRLFRQKQRGNWIDPIREVAEALRKLLNQI